MTRFLTSTRCNVWLPWIVLFIFISVLQWTGAYSALRLDLSAFGIRWIYTSLTCHLVHLSTRHWFYNTLALIVIAAYFAHLYTWQQWLLTYCLSALCVSFGLLWFAHGLHSYAGLSGVLHGLFAMGVLRLLPGQPRLAMVLGLLLLCKLLIDAQYGSVFMHHAEFVVAYRAHLFGVIGGILSWVCVYAKQRWR